MLLKREARSRKQEVKRERNISNLLIPLCYAPGTIVSNIEDLFLDDPSMKNLVKLLKLRLPKNEEGQSVVIVALFLFFVFMGFAALTVDGTVIYLHRRQLQNIADAAALGAAIQLAQGSTEAQAYQEAMDIIAAHNGKIEWYSTDPTTPNPPATNSPAFPAGTSLARGIEITNDCDVRVSLQWSDIGTNFAQFVGRKTLQVGANAHAGCNRAGGLQPIAVKRFGDERDTDDTPPPPNINDPHTIYCDDCDTQSPLAGQGNGWAYDFLRPAITDTDVITAWPAGMLMYQPPSPHADMSAGMPGRDYYILGGGVVPNVGTTSYAGWINLDIRHLSSSPKEYYNGVTPGTNSNTLKDLAEYYIRRGYCCDIPKPGDESAMLSGVSADFAAKAFQETYNIGDIVAVIVYNGTVFHAPTLDFTGSPDVAPTRPTSTTVAALNSAAVTYTLSLEAKDGFESSLQGLSLSVEGLNGFANWSFSPTDSPLLPYNGGITQRTITLHVTPTTTTVGTTTQVLTGTRLFYVAAKDDKFGGTGVRRYWTGVFTVGDQDAGGNDRDMPAVTGLPDNSDQNYPFITVEQDKQAKYTVDLDLWGGASGQNVTVTYTGGSLPTGFSWVSSPPWSQNVNNPNHHPGKSFNLNIKVDSTATPSVYPNVEVLPFLVTAANGMTQTFKLYVEVVAPQTTTVEDYVKILGYAAMEVTDYPSVNSVRGRIVSELWDDPSKLTYGLRARLIPWEQ